MKPMHGFAALVIAISIGIGIWFFRGSLSEQEHASRGGTTHRREELAPTRAPFPSGTTRPPTHQGVEVAGAPRLPSKRVLPTELPRSAKIEEVLGRTPDYRETYTYVLGLMAYYDECLGGQIERGIIEYSLRWAVGEDHVAYSQPPTIDEFLPSGQVSEHAKVAFFECVKQYLAEHDSVVLPSAGIDTTWQMTAVFPVRESQLLKLIAGAQGEHGLAE
jgi:hypothetical protein